MLRQALQEAQALDAKKLAEKSPLREASVSGPKDYYYQAHRYGNRMPAPKVDEIIASLDSEGRWISVLHQVSNPYKPIPATMPTSSEDRSVADKMVGDEYDTSPYENKSIKGISTRTYIWNMVALINALR